MEKEYKKISDGVYEETENKVKTRTITISKLDFYINRAQEEIDSATRQLADFEKLKADLLKINN